MQDHNAPAQMLGYLYQIRYALNLLMDCEDPTYQISIEKFDDVAFDKDGEPVQLIQAKHHTIPASLSDTSVDLWKTLKVWMDAVLDDYSLLDHTGFVIITTAEVPAQSAADYIQSKEYGKAYKALETVAKAARNQSNKSAYSVFLSLKKKTIMSLLKRTTIVSSSSKIEEVEKSIRKHLEFSCRPEHISIAMERVEGWWIRECIRALCSEEMTITTKRQVQDKVYDITRQYGEENLPIEFLDLEAIKETDLNPEDRIFLEQLKLLNYKNSHLRLALQDYYRATMQRSSWLQKGLVYTNELDSYELKLKDAWEHAFADMEEDLAEYDEPNEEEKVKAGRHLYRHVMNQDVRIRSGVDTAYVMKGTYHRMANNLSVGWHIEFLERLKLLLERS